MLKQCLKNMGEGLLHACISNIMMSAAPINRAEEYEYLGVTLDSHLTCVAKYSKFIRECLLVWANFRAYVRT